MTPAALRKALAEAEALAATLRAALAEAQSKSGQALTVRSSVQMPQVAPLIRANEQPAGRAADMFGVSEKTMRKLARRHGAERRLGGRVLVDTDVLRSVLEGQIFHEFPKSSTDIGAQITDHRTQTSDGESKEPHGEDC